METPKIIEALAVGRERTEEEKKRRRIHGDKGAKFSQGKQMCLLGDVSGCLTTMPAKDNLVAGIYNKDVAMTKEPIIIDDYNLRIPQATEQGYVEVPPGSLFDASYPNSKTRRGRVQDGGQTSPTLTAGGEAPSYYEGKTGCNYRIRKLTPRECFRLMGVCESDIDKIQQAGISQSRQYQLAGNSIVVDVLVQIFRKMFIHTGQESQQLSLF